MAIPDAEITIVESPRAVAAFESSTVAASESRAVVNGSSSPKTSGRSSQSRRSRAARYTFNAARAIGLSTMTGTMGIAPLRSSCWMAWMTNSVRSTANAGMMMVPLRSTVRQIADANESRPMSLWLRSPYVDSINNTSQSGRGAGGSSSG